MKQFSLGKTGISASAVAFGGIINMNETQADADRYVAAAVERGVNYFDVAPSYGDAEDRLGPALTPYLPNVYLACKTGKRDAEGAKAELTASLKKLGADHFDVYQLHAMTTRDDIEKVFGPGGAMETYAWAQREGLIRNIGFSAHNEETALQLLDRFEFDTVLFPVNWTMGIVTGWGNRISERIREKGIGLLAIKALVRRKWLEGEARVYPKSWCQPIFGDEALGVAAMKYALSKGAKVLVPPGDFEHFTFMLDHIDQAIEQPLTDEERAMLAREASLARDQLIFGVEQI